MQQQLNVMLKFISENRIGSFLGSGIFLQVSCAVIFLFSIFLRSTIDIGSDTGVYLDLGRKIAEGKKYYYDFFESNFPLSFYFYALEYQISRLTGISAIILSDLIINLLALASIFWSLKILRSSAISQNRIHLNLLIISYFLGFFLRPSALQMGEFGTKTSLLLILFYPYLSYSFDRVLPLQKRDLIYRGCLMGLIPCIKPHYLILIILIEIRQLFKKKSLSFFFELDKLLMLMIGLLYLFLMLRLTPEFFEFMVPMWSKTYSAYDNHDVFLDNSWRHFAARIMPFSFMFLAFSRIKITANDIILLLIFVSASLLILAENIATIDQCVVFYAVTTTCFIKILYDVFAARKITFSENKFIILGLLFIPAFDMGILPAAIFGLGGFVNIWWLFALFYPFFFAKKLNKEARKKYFSPVRIFLFAVIYSSLLLIAVLTLKYLGGWAFIAVDLAFLFFALFFFENKIYNKISDRFSPLTVFVMITSASCLFYSYISSVTDAARHDNLYTFPNKMSDMIVYYSKKYAPKKRKIF